MLPKALPNRISESAGHARAWHPAVERLRGTLVAGSWALLEIIRSDYADWKDELPGPREDLRLRVEILAFFLHVAGRHAQRTGRITSNDLLDTLRPTMARDLIRAAWDAQPENPFQGQGIVQQWQMARVLQQIHEADTAYATCREIAGRAINSTQHVLGRFVRRAFAALDVYPPVDLSRDIGQGTLDILTRIRLPTLVHNACVWLDGHH
ncbi:MAG: hypothetical protein J7M15_05795 [Anaerolineae bacterium]|nr:hypothetical protein [Anaerolineae bacterium]